MAGPEKERIYGGNEFDKDYLVSIIGTGQRDFPENRPRGGGGGGGKQKICRTPVAGIGPGSFSGSSFNAGSATCVVWDQSAAGVWSATSNSIVVYNISDADIAGEVMIKVASVSSGLGKVWVVDVAGCGTGGTSLQSYF